LPKCIFLAPGPLAVELETYIFTGSPRRFWYTQQIWEDIS
jgi:hypothetical protein